MATEQQLITRAIEEAGCNSENAKFEFSFAYGTSGGVFTVDVNSFVTDPVTHPCSAAALKEALEDLSSVGEGGVIVRGAIGGPFETEFIGANAGQVMPLPVVDGSDLTPTQTVMVEEIQQGDPTDYVSDATIFWEDYENAATDTLRFLYTKRGLIRKRIGRLSNETDVRIGRDNQAEEAGSKRFQQALELLKRVENEIDAEIGVINASSRRGYGSQMTTTTPNGLPYGMMSRNVRNGRFR
jgi:hypothetical protein